MLLDIRRVWCGVRQPWASCQIRKIAGAHAPGIPGTLSPSPQVSDPDMHHGTCVTHVPWCMPGSLTSGSLWNWRRGKTFPAFPAHAQPAMLRIWQEAHCSWLYAYIQMESPKWYPYIYCHALNGKVVCNIFPLLLSALCSHRRQFPYRFYFYVQACLPSIIYLKFKARPVFICIGFIQTPTYKASPNQFCKPQDFHICS